MSLLPDFTLALDEDPTNRQRLSTCLRHRFMPSDYPGIALCEECGGIVPSNLAEWYNYGSVQALATVNTLLDKALAEKQASHE
jgi:hypothetical protein